ncbi:AraC family transcriptional regulator [Luteibacter aegosomaticola]|uniref:AraC family transcriptional regulator n=1 Tax=Luteibacter aegosomaticola TaxID=2911538 RepID=UPI001FF7702D|nr:AraC family transcriptional regulator [Luteibacter aegosomaticola]UPG90982.1 AraC family transcriptional regulator [Luteibacter aegosomaticola]
MYRAETACSVRIPRTPTLVIDLAQRSAALDRPSEVTQVQAWRDRLALTEIVIGPDDGADDDLLLVYRTVGAADPGAGAILFRRAPDSSDIVHPPAVRSLAQVLFDTLRAEQPNAPLMAHVALALRAILPAPQREDAGAIRGGLANWQERRALAFMEQRLDQSFPVSDVADACGLSVNHFSRAFRRSLGKPPHRWLLERRIGRARELLQTTELSLADIALACGFAEQSHFTRVFTRLVGMPPGAWRRAAE